MRSSRRGGGAGALDLDWAGSGATPVSLARSGRRSISSPARTPKIGGESGSGGSSGLQVGQRVHMPHSQLTGTVRFLGRTSFAEGVFAGIELTRPAGRNDGAVQGKRYFSCPPRYGLFVRPSSCRVLSDGGGDGLPGSDIRYGYGYGYGYGYASGSHSILDGGGELEQWRKSPITGPAKLTSPPDELVNRIDLALSDALSGMRNHGLVLGSAPSKNSNSNGWRDRVVAAGAGAAGIRGEDDVAWATPRQPPTPNSISSWTERVGNNDSDNHHSHISESKLLDLKESILRELQQPMVALESRVNKLEDLVLENRGTLGQILTEINKFQKAVANEESDSGAAERLHLFKKTLLTVHALATEASEKIEQSTAVASPRLV